jgi:response regulator RpfG family c-di-GMP phosphodiesterase
MIAAEPTRAESAPLTHHHLVLCVDDEPRTLAALRRTFRREPFELVVTSNPWQALSWVDSRDVSLVISDQRMPEMLGSEMISEIRGRSPGTLCVLLTAFPASAGPGAPGSEDVGRLLLKPWNDQQLRKTVRDLLYERETGYRPPDAEDVDIGGDSGGA